MAEEMLLAEVEGPKGKAEIFEVTLPNTGSMIEVEYAVVFGAQRLSFPSMGEAHLKANELTGAD
jgi:hypothetical protein